MLEPAALGFAEADAIYNAGVIELVADDGAFGIEQGFKETSVGIETRGVEDGVVVPQEGGYLVLELLVDVLGSADEPHGGHTVAVFLQSPFGCFHQTGMVGEPQVIVGAEVDYLAIFYLYLRPLGREYDPLILIKPGVADVLQLCFEAVFHFSIHLCSSLGYLLEIIMAFY